MFEKTEISDFYVNPFDKIGKEWMLINASKPDGSYNPMTASWGGLGVLWNRNVCFCFIRDSRHTDVFAREGDVAAICFFDDENRGILNYCGRYSGRDTDKVADCKLTPITHPSGAVYFEEAKEVIVVKKLYTGKIEESGFNDRGLLKNYADNDYHNVYVYEIIQILSKK